MSKQLEGKNNSKDLAQRQTKNDGLFDAFKRVTNILEYKNQSNKILNKNFEKSAILDSGKVTMTVNICDLPSKQVVNALDKLQKFSDELMFKEISDSITKR
ncbi:MAG: hypothetical protein PHX70_08565 [Clostridium sp.]|nr:hypothetical protein [Clostridium sp.]